MKQHFTFEDARNGEVHGIKAFGELDAAKKLREYLALSVIEFDENFTLVAVEEIDG